jgi:hypothetical protein
MSADVRLRNGTRLWGGGSVLVARNERLVDVRVRDLAVGDWVAMPYGDGFGCLPQALLPVDLPTPHGSQKRVRLPHTMDEDLALLLGMYASEGHTNASNYTIVITNSEEPVLDRCVELWKHCFDLEARITRQPGRCPGVEVSSKTVVEFMDVLGCGTRASDKRIPRAVLDSPEAAVLAFLQGLALDAYTTTSGSTAKWAICLDAPLLLDELQTLLRRFGLLSGRSAKYNPKYRKTYDEVYLAGSEAQRMTRLVAFLEPTKQRRALDLLELAFDPRRNAADLVPLVHGSRLYAEFPQGTSGKSGKGSGIALVWRNLCDKRTVWPSRHTVERIAEAAYRLPRDVRRVLDENLHFSPVAASGCRLDAPLGNANGSSVGRASWRGVPGG